MREFLAFVLAVLILGAAVVVLALQFRGATSGDRDEIRNAAGSQQAEQQTSRE